MAERKSQAGEIRYMVERVLAITEGTPYKGEVTARSPSGMQQVKGDVIFSVEGTALKFRFFPEEDDSFDVNPYKLFAAANEKDGEVILHIPSQDLTYPAQILSAPHRGTITVGKPIDRACMNGIIATNHFGSNTVPLKSVTIWISNLTEFSRHEGTYYKSGIVHSPDEDPIGWRALSSLTLDAGGWNAVLREIPSEWNPSPTQNHLCIIRRDGNASFTADDFLPFLEELLSFLAFTFGQRLQLDVAIGYGDESPSEKWGAVIPSRPTSYNARNWFLRSLQTNLDISSLFSQFHAQPDEIKNHWYQVIDAYVTSEEIAHSLGRYEVAESVSYASLQGLTKSIISTYEPEAREKYLDKRLEFKYGRMTKEAIRFVIKRELGRPLPEDILNRISNIRHDTMHLNLMASQDAKDALYRWDNSQCLVELVLLSKLGMKEIPNRTAPGKFEVMGKDMLWKRRQEAIEFQDDDQS